MTAAVAVGCSLLDTYLLRCGHKVDGRVVAVVFLRQAEGELVVDEERVCLKPVSQRGRNVVGITKRSRRTTQSSLKVTQEHGFRKLLPFFPRFKHSIRDLRILERALWWRSGQRMGYMTACQLAVNYSWRSLSGQRNKTRETDAFRRQGLFCSYSSTQIIWIRAI